MSLSRLTHRVFSGTRPPAGRWLALALSAVGILLACERDIPTEPHTELQPAPASGASLAQAESEQTLPPPEGSEVPYGITVTRTDHDRFGALSWQKLGEMPRWVVGQMKIRQQAIQSGADRGTLVAGPQGIFVPGFFDNRCVLKAAMGWREPSGVGGWTEDWRAGGANCPSQAEVDQNPNLTWLRTGYTLWGGRSDGSFELCGRGCHTYGGYTTFIFTPTSNVLKVVATVVRVLVGGKVKFVASRIDGVALTAVERWVWRPKNSAVTPRTIACSHTDPECETEVYEDGYMFAHVVIDGFLHTGNAGVMVEHKFELQADKTEADVGETVTFEPIRDGQRVAAALWRWVPQAAEGEDPASVTPVEVEACAGNDVCPWVLSGSGTMWAYLSDPPSGRTDEEASRPVAARSKPALEIVFAPEAITPLIPRQLEYHKGLCNTDSIHSDRRFEVQVKDASGQAVPNQIVSLSLAATPKSGGHDHASVPNSELSRPLGHFAGTMFGPEITTISTGASGTGTFHYIPPEFTGEITITGKSPGASDGTHTLTVARVFEPMIAPELFRPIIDMGTWAEVRSPDGTFILFDGDKYKDHPWTHYGRSALLKGLRELAQHYHLFFQNEKYNMIYFNDLSLPGGGRFDAEADWGTDEHCSHRRGDAADVRTKAPYMNKVQLDFLEVWWHAYTGWREKEKPNTAKPEGDHWHIRLKPGR